VRAVFLGTPDVAVPSLDALSRIGDVAAVITQPDRPRGRSKKPQPPAVKERALALGIPVHQPASSTAIAPLLEDLDGIDVAVIVAFGMLIRPDALAVPARGFVNVHFSILPRWRGAAPVQRAIQAGDRTTGVTLMALDEGLDTGPVYSTRVTTLSPDETAGDVFDRLADTGARHLQQWLPSIAARRVVATRQNDQEATHAAKISPDERRLALDAPATTIRRLVHAMSPAPGAFAMLGDDRFKLLRVQETDLPSSDPGALVLNDGRLLMGTATTMLELVEIQPFGKRVMSGHDWAMGRRDALGMLT
jgi:methionyl-tRNA formyltransferase